MKGRGRWNVCRSTPTHRRVSPQSQDHQPCGSTSVAAKTDQPPLLNITPSSSLSLPLPLPPYPPMENTYRHKKTPTRNDITHYKSYFSRPPSDWSYEGFLAHCSLIGLFKFNVLNFRYLKSLETIESCREETPERRKKARSLIDRHKAGAVSLLVPPPLCGISALGPGQACLGPVIRQHCQRWSPGHGRLRARPFAWRGPHQRWGPDSPALPRSVIRQLSQRWSPGRRSLLGSLSLSVGESLICLDGYLASEALEGCCRYSPADDRARGYYQRGQHGGGFY